MTKFIVRGLVAVALLAGPVTAQTEAPAAAAPAVAAPTTAPAPAGDPQAHAVLKSAVEFYKAAKSVSCDLTSEMKVVRPGMTQITNSSYAIAMKRPNQLAIVMNEGMNGGTIVSDGKTLSFYVPQMEKYATEDAPADLEGAMEKSQFALSAASVGGTLVIAILSNDPYEKILEGV